MTVFEVNEGKRSVSQLNSNFNTMGNKIDLLSPTVSGKFLHGSSHKMIAMTEKVKTVIACYFLLPNFLTSWTPYRKKLNHMLKCHF